MVLVLELTELLMASMIADERTSFLVHHLGCMLRVILPIPKPSLEFECICDRVFPTLINIIRFLVKSLAVNGLNLVRVECYDLAEGYPVLGIHYTVIAFLDQ